MPATIRISRAPYASVMQMKSSAFTRLYMLEIDNLPYATINLNRETRAEISTINH